MFVKQKCFQKLYQKNEYKAPKINKSIAIIEKSKKWLILETCSKKLYQKNEFDAENP